MTINLGSYLGPYEIISKLGSGGMGEIYQAIDKRLDREVAIKVLPNLFSKDTQALARFKQEMKSLAALSHINILTIYEFDKDQDIYFAATELLKGETLRSCINRAILDWQQALEIAIQIAEGLSAAHSKKIVHRDIKPENIFITSEGCIKILDFGLAKIEKTPLIASQDIPQSDTFSETFDSDNNLIYFAEEYKHRVSLLDETTIISGGNKVANTPVNIYVKQEESRNSALQKNSSYKSLEKSEINPDDLTTNTQPGEIMGTIPYMSPEQLQGKNVDARSDIFSFGSVLYEMLTGTRPFYRTTIANTATAILVDDPPKINKEINKELEWVIIKCLEKNKHKRFQSGQELVLALKTISSSIKSISSSQTKKIQKKIPVGKTINSIAVFPFVNAGSDLSTEYLIDGIVETIINGLAKLPKLRVMARNTVFQYKGKIINAQEVGAILNVSSILLGRVFQVGDNLKVRVELVNTSDGSLIWSDQYNKKLIDVFAVEEEIANQILENLQLKISQKEKKRIVKRSTNNLKAYQLYLKGRFYLNQLTIKAINKSIEYFNLALEEDSNYALAFAGLADAYTLSSVLGLAPRETSPLAKQAALEALKIDNDLAEVHASLGLIKLDYEYDWLGAEKSFKQALKLNPSYSAAHHWYSLYFGAIGQMDLATKELTKAIEYDPLSPVINVDLGWPFYFGRKFDEAIKHYEKAVDMDPNFYLAYYWLGLAYEQVGNYKKAIESFNSGINISRGVLLLAALAHVYGISGNEHQARLLINEMENLTKDSYVPAYRIAIAYLGLGEKEIALKYLEKAYFERDAWIIWLKVDPLLDPLRNESKFISLINKIWS